MKRGRPKLTLKKRVLNLLDQDGGWHSLDEFYRKFHIRRNKSQQAALRGVFNHDISDKSGLFERHPQKPGQYRITSLGITSMA